MLYLVGTPIGNLEDFSPRAVRILKEVDFIAAEDTRVTAKLLNHFSIKKPMVSYHAHNLRMRGEELIERLLAGENGAVVSDAGMPCISDPGEDLVKLCAKAGIPVTVIPGPSAGIAALSVSGLPAARFSFEGFLSVNKKSRTAHLEEIREYPHTMIFYEAPHKLLATLTDLYAALGERPITLVRELTKLHEEICRTTLSEAITRYTETPPRGEFVLVVGGYIHKQKPVTAKEAAALAKKRVAAGERPSDAARAVARQTGIPKSEIYRLLTGDSADLTES